MIHLYVKQHNITKLKYFGKTYAQNPFEYMGSGKYWLRHIKKHGKEHVITLNVWSFNSQKDATEFALKYSSDNDITKSEDWANLKEENALDGNPLGNWKGMTYEEIFGEEKAKMLRESRSNSNKNRKYNEKTIMKMRSIGKTYIGEKNPMFGRHHSDEAKLKIGKAAKNRKWTPEQKEKWLESRKNLKISHKEKICPHCNTAGKGGNMTRYHFDNCRFLSR